MTCTHCGAVISTFADAQRRGQGVVCRDVDACSARKMESERKRLNAEFPKGEGWKDATYGG